MVMNYDNFGKIYSVELGKLARDDYARIIKGMNESPKATVKYIEKFEIEVETIIEILKEFPYIGRGIVDGDDNVRYKSIPGYDYAIYYDVDDDELDVLAFAFVPERAGQQTIDGLLTERINLLSAEKKD
jgi:plasmid stabilization system protein ParE